MSWTYIVLGVAVVVLLFNIAVVFLLVYSRTRVGSHDQGQDH